MSQPYLESEKLLARALEFIPLGTQTFSKSKTQYPFGVSPYFLTKGFGSHVWDVDGNEYIDFINGLAAITLGYNDPDVTAAVYSQLQAGVIFSLPHPLEIRVAEKLIEMVPCAEMVRFGKNGSDATTGAIRLARAYTRRDHIAVCGYHGWHDWYIGSTTRNLGVPKSVQALTHTFTYNNLDSLHQIFQECSGEVAAIIMEPVNVVTPQESFLESVKELAHQNGALLIFDETITGFRFANGGAQEYFGIIPDLATFGKGLANGFPLSSIVGKADIMQMMEDIFFSFTFGGETLSLAAALATMTKLETLPVVDTLRQQGQKIVTGLQQLIEQQSMSHIVSIAGYPCWSFVLFKDVYPYSQWQIKTLFLQEMFSKGILTLGTHNMSYSHSDIDVEKLLSVYGEVFLMLQDVVTGQNLEKYLKCQQLEPLFKIR